MELEFSEVEETNSSGVDEEMNFILDMIQRKCSICFTSDSDTELSNCGDQFCFECLETYWVKKLKESLWGVKPTILDCPVCRIPVKETNWLFWASPELKDLFSKSTFRRSSISRNCNNCGHEQTLFGDAIEDFLVDLLNAMRGDFPEDLYQQLFECLDSESYYSELIKILLQKSSQVQGSIEFVYLLRKILQISRLLDTAENFAKNQLSVIKINSGTICDSCSAKFCLRCGLSNWHNSCSIALKEQLLSISKDSPDYANLLWKMENGRHCPSCFTLITKDDDGSCNQVHCSYCGFSFCWECEREWSNSCGFYRCSMESNGYNSSKENQRNFRMRKENEMEPEAGIPDVTKLPNFSPR